MVTLPAYPGCRISFEIMRGEEYLGIYG